jgi:microcystin-dependent protein
MSEPFVGQIIQGGWNFAPRGYMFCNGQLLSIAQNSALFALLGTNYGGDGQVTFGLPNLQSREMMHWGNGAGLTPRVIGETAGTEQVALTSGNLPAHNHGFSSTSTMNATTAKGTLNQPAAGTLLAKSVDNSGTIVPLVYAPAGTTPTADLGGLNVAGTIGVSGSNQPVGTISTFQCVSHCIALEGLFPSRN